MTKSESRFRHLAFRRISNIVTNFKNIASDFVDLSTLKVLTFRFPQLNINSTFVRFNKIFHLYLPKYIDVIMAGYITVPLYKIYVAKHMFLEFGRFPDDWVPDIFIVK